MVLSTNTICKVSFLFLNFINMIKISKLQNHEDGDIQRVGKIRLVRDRSSTGVVLPFLVTGYLESLCRLNLHLVYQVCVKRCVYSPR